MKEKLPDFLERVIAEYPGVWKSYQNLGEACNIAGPLDEKTTRLVKLALAIGARSEGAVHSHTRRALKSGITREETATGSTACDNICRLVTEHGCSVLDSRCHRQKRGRKGNCSISRKELPLLESSVY